MRLLWLLLLPLSHVLCILWLEKKQDLKLVAMIIHRIDTC